MVQYICKEKKLKKSSGLKGESHMSANKTKEINNLDDFQDGIFKIERNGKIIQNNKRRNETIQISRHSFKRQRRADGR